MMNLVKNTALIQMLLRHRTLQTKVNAKGSTLITWRLTIIHWRCLLSVTAYVAGTYLRGVNPRHNCGSAAPRARTFAPRAFSRQDLGINLNWIFKFCSSLSFVSALKCRHRKSFLEVQNIKNKHKNQFKTENLRNLGVTHNKKEVYLELETLTRWQRDSAQKKHFYFTFFIY